jgi:murein L,D-transpeptidase YafK
LEKTGKIDLKKIIAKYKDSRYASFLNKNMLKSIALVTGGMLVFIFGCIIYGVVLNLREEPLKEEMRLKGFRELKEANLVIDRKTFSLHLYEDTVLVKSYRASFGKNNQTPKSRSADGATPVGEYAVCTIDTAHMYYKYFRINYPNLEDAAAALRAGVINQRKFDQLKFDYYYAECISPDSPLGGNVGIHGIGEYNFFFKNLPFVFNWTDGSVAISNESIDEIFSVIKKGTKVVIK